MTHRNEKNWANSDGLKSVLGKCSYFFYHFWWLARTIEVHWLYVV